MSDNIPFELQIEIIKRVRPVKSLIRFRSVSKQWKSLIDSSEFITHHIVKHSHPPHLLVKNRYIGEYNYVSIVDDDSFPRHKFHPTPDLLTDDASFLDCSHGLVCLYGSSRDPINTKKLIVVWNPSIRKSVSVAVPNGLVAVGFGVCPKTNDPKIVQITSSSLSPVDWKAEVFTLSTRAWRSIPVNVSIPSEPDGFGNDQEVEFEKNQVVIDGIIYWLAYDFHTEQALIISFDLTSEELGKVAIPVDLAIEYELSIYKFKDSVALLRLRGNKVYDVWTMTKNSDGEFSFTKQFEIDFSILDGDPRSYYSILGFRANGQPIMEEGARLKVFEPYSQRISDLEIDGDDYLWFEMASYTESLLLINHSASVIH
ncbi:hypothetical protein SSX86_000680 [Deinandra increscens subsp. villosa]|uniref:F-box domain-containing protein n=1 Tax=Deinandra increscens subsp. villosa TaxID=3103831 RepID=A0AAP0DQB6_9ASTR